MGRARAPAGAPSGAGAPGSCGAAMVIEVLDALKSGDKRSAGSTSNCKGSVSHNSEVRVRVTVTVAPSMEATARVTRTVT